MRRLFSRTPAPSGPAVAALMPLVDIMTILLVAILRTWSTQPPLQPVEADFALPMSRAEGEPSLSLAIGGILFGHEDDIEASDGDVPALVLVDGALVGLDFVALVSISGTDAIGSPFDSSDLGQDTSGFLSSPHYWVDFDDEATSWSGWSRASPSSWIRKTDLPSSPRSSSSSRATWFRSPDSRS